MNYEELSDFEISSRVAAAISKTDFEVNNFEIVRYFCNGQHLDEPEVFDPCNNPEDAWPIISENRISVVFSSSDVAYVSDVETKKVAMHRNPLRAAMICYLMMQEKK